MTETQAPSSANLSVMETATPEENLAAIGQMIFAAGLWDHYNQTRMVFFAQTGRPLSRREFLEKTAVPVLVQPATFITMIQMGLPFVMAPARGAQPAPRPSGIEIARV